MLCIRTGGMTSMHHPYLIDFIAFLVCIRLFTMETIRNEYVYQVISAKHNFTGKGTLNVCTKNGSQHSDLEKIVADEVSRWSMYADLAGSITSIVSALVLTTWSDKVGRKLPLAITLTGFFVTAIVQTLVIFLSWPLDYLIVNEAICGSCGYYAALLYLALAYLSDVTRDEERGKRYNILECIMGLGGGVSLFGTGFWIKAHGFAPSCVFAAACSAVALILLPLIPSATLRHPSTISNPGTSSPDSDDTMVDAGVEQPHYSEYGAIANKEKPNGNTLRNNSPQSFQAKVKLVWQICTSNKSICNTCNEGSKYSVCPHGGGVRRGRTMMLWLFITTFSFYVLAMIGPTYFQTMYYLSYPMCFDATLVGAERGFAFALNVLSPLLVKFYQSVLQLTNLTVITIGVFTRMLDNLLLSFAKAPYQVFIATGFSFFANITTPFIRAEVSSLVSLSEQGTIFGLLSFVESVTDLLAMFAFLSIYPATLHISHGFGWLCSAIILCLPLSLVIVLQVAGKKLRKPNDEKESLIQESSRFIS